MTFFLLTNPSPPSIPSVMRVAAGIFLEKKGRGENIYIM
jgi:hypothetical protein